MPNNILLETRLLRSTTMKKCPYCAEKIQNEAIKCKHCGEWLENKGHPEVTVNDALQLDEIDDTSLTCEACQSNKPKEDFIDDLTVCKDCSESNIQASKDSDSKEDSILNNERSSVILGELGRWGCGWGWLVLVLFYANGVFKLPFQNSGKGALVQFIVLFGGLFILLYSYFKLRNRIIREGNYGKKTAGASLKAGFLCYVATLLFLIPFGYFLYTTDKNHEKSQIEDFSSQFIEKTNMLTKEEGGKRLDKLINEPNSEADLQHNIKILDDYLIFMDKQIIASKEMINFFNDLSDRRKDKLLSQDIKNLELLLNKYHDTSVRSIKTLISHYKVRDEESWNTYNNLLSETHKLEAEYASAIDRIADILAR